MNPAPQPKTVFITGCSSGIGLATAQLFFARGWNVAATMRTPSASDLPALTGTTPDSDNRLLVIPLDVTESASIGAAVAAAISAFGTIDVLVNNAGYGQGGLFEALSRERVQKQFDVNVFGVMDVTRALLPHLRANPSDTAVVNVSSGAGLWGLPMTSLYSASKFALEGFTEALSYELASQNIRVKSVIPHGGVTATQFGARFAAGSADAGGPGPGVAEAYAAFVQKTRESFAKMVAGAAISSADVADTIYAAATDGTARLRYLVGDDARGFVAARYSSSDDASYMAAMRAYFA
ncbi:3-oxoacyl-(Acyl-carrier-protein) reductase [Mycena indigotica]|uniref:3-oxoacyl-(Acyl-carrier-protein) reductase n=1 Tax=Mycena indigotica TaxID=2126181 RepID=A0A8H6SYR5_9AGAR|nr:3-oxoacyl-(Acyl-carrier-protein) reductase [Mycena indigotica]KAF7306370.1 3-oxoacyl-(Acyl-carrier-protein) reductase [Mycena indigotica]